MAYMVCKVCGVDLDYAGTGRIPEFCSNACRQRNYRQSRKSARKPDALRNSGTVIAPVVRRVYLVRGCYFDLSE